MTSKIDLDEALERYHHTALRVRDEAHAAGAAAESARVRRDLLAWMRIERAEGRAMTPNRLKAALDRICPEEG